MNTYTVLFAVDVPYYGSHEIEAENTQAAMTAAEALHKADGVHFNEPEWEYAGCARIVHITDPDGYVVAHDKALDDSFIRYGGDAARVLCDKAEAMLEAIREIARTPLCGEHIEDDDVKNTLAQAGEYDLDDDEFTPSGDTEHDQLRDVVETARAMLVELEDAGYPEAQS